jgi:hypothetical protein
MLVIETDDDSALGIDHKRIAMILGAGLVTTVGHRAFGDRPADDGGEQKESLLERQFEATVVGIHECV